MTRAVRIVTFVLVLLAAVIGVPHTRVNAAGGRAFVILDVGDNKHSEALRPLIGRATDAAEVLRLIRKESPGCVSVANANILISE